MGPATRLSVHGVADAECGTRQEHNAEARDPGAVDRSLDGGLAAEDLLQGHGKNKGDDQRGNC